MKKMIVLAAALVAAVAVEAASVAWQYTATSTDVDKTVYVLVGSAAQETWENVDALSSAAVTSAKVEKQGRSGYFAYGVAAHESITKDSASIYYVVVAKDGQTFDVTSVSDMTASVYDPANKETSTGSNTSLSSANITKSGLAWGSGSDPVVPTPTPIDPSGVPEPTSGLLLLVGGAALALRRKQK